MAQSTSSGLQVIHQGVVSTATSNVILLLYYNHTVYYQNSSQLFYNWNGSQWISTTDPRLSKNIPSSNGTIVSNTTGSIIDSTLNVWTLVLNGSTYQIAENGVVNTSTNNISYLLYWNSIVYYYQSSTSAWDYWNGNAWVTAGGDPRATAVTLNPLDKSASIVLSNSNLTATSVGAVSQSVRSSIGYSTGSYYFEVTANTLTNDFAIGISTSAYTLSAVLQLGGEIGTGVGYYCVSPPQSIYTGLANTVPASTGTGADVNEDVLSCAVNFTTHLIWFSSPVMRKEGFTWNNVSGANPATGVGGAVPTS